MPAPTAGFDGKTIRLGLLYGTNTPGYQSGSGVVAGVEARIDNINKRGGIAGRYKIELVRVKTEGDGAATVNAIKATQSTVAGYVSIFGASGVESAEPVLRAFQMLASPTTSEAKWNSTGNLVLATNSYQSQASNAVRYFAEHETQGVICTLANPSSYGDATVEGVKYGAEHFQVTLGPTLTISAETDLPQAIQSLRSANCTGVVAAITPQQSAAVMNTLKPPANGPKWFLMQHSFNATSLTSANAVAFSQSAVVVGEGNSWGDPNSPLSRTLSADLTATKNRFWNENPDPSVSVGYLQARIFEAVLEKAVAAGNLDRPSLVATFHQPANLDMGGLASAATFAETGRLNSSVSSIFAVDPTYKMGLRFVANTPLLPGDRSYDQ